jgi:hypothetical protein
MEQLKNVLKTIVIVVRIGHTARCTGVGIVEYQAYFFALGLGPCMVQNIGMVSGIHGQDKVEALEVFRFELACALVGDVDTVLAGYGDGTSVGQFAGVPVAGAGAVDAPVESGLRHFSFHNAFGEWASADVSEANH